MRPSDITDGILPMRTDSVALLLSSFNEAVGYYRRNPNVSSGIRPRLPYMLQ